MRDGGFAFLIWKVEILDFVAAFGPTLVSFPSPGFVRVHQCPPWLSPIRSVSIPGCF